MGSCAICGRELPGHTDPELVSCARRLASRPVAPGSRDARAPQPARGQEAGP